MVQDGTTSVRMPTVQTFTSALLQKFAKFGTPRQSLKEVDAVSIFYYFVTGKRLYFYSIFCRVKKKKQCTIYVFVQKSMFYSDYE